MTIDVARARAETPGGAEVLHFSNAGASLPPRPVLDAIIGHLQLEVRTGGNEAAEASRTGRPAEEVKRLLGAHAINVSVSPVAYARLDLESRDLPALVRASVHYYNTEAEADRFCEVLARECRSAIHSAPGG